MECCGDPATQHRGAKVTGGGGRLLEPFHAPLQCTGSSNMSSNKVATWPIYCHKFCSTSLIPGAGEVGFRCCSFGHLCRLHPSSGPLGWVSCNMYISFFSIDKLLGQLAAVLFSLGVYTWVEHSLRDKLARTLDASIGARKEVEGRRKVRPLTDNGTLVVLLLHPFQHREGSAWVYQYLPQLSYLQLPLPQCSRSYYFNFIHRILCVIMFIFILKYIKKN